MRLEARGSGYRDAARGSWLVRAPCSVLRACSVRAPCIRVPCSVLHATSVLRASCSVLRAQRPSVLRACSVLRAPCSMHACGHAPCSVLRPWELVGTYGNLWELVRTSCALLV